LVGKINIVDGRDRNSADSRSRDSDNFGTLISDSEEETVPYERE